MSVGKEFSTDVSHPPENNEYPAHNIEERACDPGEHDLVEGPVKFTKLCSNCGYGLGTLVDLLGHDPRGGVSA